MPTPTTVDSEQRHVIGLAPAPSDRLDSPYSISNDFYAALRHVQHDVAGQPDIPVPYLDKEELDWEARTYVTCEVLAWRGVWNAEWRRRMENDIGETLYYGLPYYGRWLTGAAKTLVDRGLVTLPELSTKIDEVRARKEAQQ